MVYLSIYKEFSKLQIAMARILIEALQICKGQAKDSGELFLSNICKNCGTYGQNT